MTSYDDWYPSNYFKADDVIDNPLDLTITDIHPEKMQDGNSQARRVSSRRTSAVWC